MGTHKHTHTHKPTNTNKSINIHPKHTNPQILYEHNTQCCLLKSTWHAPASIFSHPQVVRSSLSSLVRLSTARRVSSVCFNWGFWLPVLSAMQVCRYNHVHAITIRIIGRHTLDSMRWNAIRCRCCVCICVHIIPGQTFCWVFLCGDNDVCVFRSCLEQSHDPKRYGYRLRQTKRTVSVVWFPFVQSILLCSNWTSEINNYN